MIPVVGALPLTDKLLGRMVKRLLQRAGAED